MTAIQEHLDKTQVGMSECGCGVCQLNYELARGIILKKPDAVFDYKQNNYMAVQSDDELLDRMARRPALMISCMRGAGVGAAARSLARSLFRTARELEHRGYSAAMILDHQNRTEEEYKHSYLCSDSAV